MLVWNDFVIVNLNIIDIFFVNLPCKADISLQIDHINNS